jgi:FlaA1/EpsC-like NDP-sugar epimerase
MSGLNINGRLRALGASSRFVILWIQPAIFALAGVAAFLIRFELSLPPTAIEDLRWALPIWIIVKTAVFRALKLERGSWAFVSVPDFLRVGLANLIGSALSAIAIALLAPPGFPRSVYIIDLLLCTYGTEGIRLLVRVLRDPAAARGNRRRSGKCVLIYGAGQAGVMLLRELRANTRLGYDVRGFIDDNPEKTGYSVQLSPVLGTGRHLARVVDRHNIDEVLVAIPSATGPQLTRILQHCQDAGVPCKAIPSLASLIQQSSLSVQMREVAVEDLLSRTPVRLDETGIREKLRGKTVVVTGAAGSIGSELCRQIARFRPDAIVAYDIAETGLFHLEQEMRASFPEVAFCPEIGSIQNRLRLEEVFEQHRPSILYHAAAYKHVSMMEAHLFEALENNVLGTWNVADVAAQYGVSDFVMISSDKAVRPTGVMGVSKRIAELLIKSFENSGSKYVSVRFGNVLGSNGSVVPLFKKQIAAGGPVTVTHPDMCRYFMTIPEAVQLVLQASTMGKGGEIFVLDMGEPVKIVDLARNLITLSGLRPDRDIKLEFTGVRPGEKLCEELCNYEEDMLPTYHEKVKIYSGNGVPREGMEPHIRVIRNLCTARDAKHLVLELKKLVPEYTPSAELLQPFLSDEVVALLSGGMDIDLSGGHAKAAERAI